MDGADSSNLPDSLCPKERAARLRARPAASKPRDVLVRSDLGANEPVTDEEIRLILGALGDIIERILSEA